MRASLALALVFLTAAAPSAAAAPEKRPGTPPKLLNVVRQTLKKGAASTYAAIEASIVRGYERAKIPLYWIGLQSSKAPAEILYLNLYDTPDGPDRAQTTYKEWVPKHPELVKLQDRLVTYGAAPAVSTLMTRRDEFVYGRRDVDFATMGALRVTVFHVKAGHEGDFVDAAQTGRVVPWQIGRAHV